MATTTVTTKFYNPSRTRRREWQRAAHLYRDTKQFCIDGWVDRDFDKSVTTASIDNDLYSAIQNQAIREAKSDYNKDGEVHYCAGQPFAVNNQNWKIDTTDNGTIIIAFPCISRWWYTPIEIFDHIASPVDRLLEGNAKKTRLQVYRRGEDWFCTFTVRYDSEPGGETPIGVDIGERHILAVTAYGESESMLISGREAKYVRRKYPSLYDSLQEAGALRARNRIGNKEQRRIKDLNHKFSQRLIAFAEQFENPLVRIEDLEGIRENSSWSGIHTWHFHQLQQFITYKAERAGICVEKVDAYHTSQQCSACGSVGIRDGDHFSCSECGRGRHADLNASENIAQREGELCTA